MSYDRTTTQADIDAANDLILNRLPPEPESKIKRDHHNNYLIVNPDTGKEEKLAPVTTVIRGWEDDYGIRVWEDRKLVRGLCMSEDLYAMGASIGPEGDDADDRKTIDYIIKTARERAAQDAKANLGTALHKFTQRTDVGENGVEVPSYWKADIAAYLKTLRDYHLWPSKYIELTMANFKLGIAGTGDRLMEGDELSLLTWADLKTGSAVKKGKSWAMQCGLYANMTHMVVDGVAVPMPEVDKKRAIVIHLPVGEGECNLFNLDIERGFQTGLMALERYKQRNVNDYATPYSSFALEDSTPAEDEGEAGLFKARHDYARRRVVHIVEHGRGNELGVLWPNEIADIKTFPQGGPRDHDEIDRVLHVCSRVEAQHELPFPTFQDPADEKTNTNNMF